MFHPPNRQSVFISAELDISVQPMGLTAWGISDAMKRITTVYQRGQRIHSLLLVGGLNHLEKYESQWEGLSHILWKIKAMFETTNQISDSWDPPVEPQTLPFSDFIRSLPKNFSVWSLAALARGVKLIFLLIRKLPCGGSQNEDDRYNYHVADLVLPHHTWL